MTLQDYITKEYPAPAVGYLAEVLGIAKHEEAENMEKSALIRQEAELLLTPDMMARRLSVLTDRQMELFERGLPGAAHAGAGRIGRRTGIERLPLCVFSRYGR